MPWQAKHPGGPAACAGQAARGLQHPVLTDHVSAARLCPPSPHPLRHPSRVWGAGTASGAPQTGAQRRSIPRAPSHVQSHFSGSVVGESAMRGEQDVGSPLAFDFQVSWGWPARGGVLADLGSSLALLRR